MYMEGNRVREREGELLKEKYNNQQMNIYIYTQGGEKRERERERERGVRMTRKSAKDKFKYLQMIMEQ